MSVPCQNGSQCDWEYHTKMCLKLHARRIELKDILDYLKKASSNAFYIMFSIGKEIHLFLEPEKIH